MPDPTTDELDKLKAALSGLEAQRGLLGEAIVGPAAAALRQQIAALEAQLASAKTPASKPESEPRSEERRIITILFSDLVGSTAHAEKMDPEDWRAVVAKVHAIAGRAVQRHQGTVLQYLGDGLLAVFGAVVSSENDPAHAVLAGLQIQKDMAPTGYSLRIGIHTGLVVIGEFGADSHRELTATGDAMNLAARLQSAAPSGGVLISHDTYRYIHGAFDATPQPPVSLKGKSEPVQTYLVQRPRPRRFHTSSRGVAGIKTHTVGRETEQRVIQNAFQRVILGRQLAWVQLVGEPGVGKSRLLEDQLETLVQHPQDTILLRARSLQGDAQRPYNLIRQFLFDRFQIAEDIPLEEAEKLWMEGFASLGAGEEDSRVIGLMVGLRFKSAAGLAGLRHDPTQITSLAYSASLRFLTAFRQRLPLVFLIEDLHWIDSASWDFLIQVVLAQEPSAGSMQGVFVLATARPEWKPPDTLISHPAYEKIELAPIPPVASHALAGELLQRVGDVPPAVLQMIVERSDGIPYFIEEIVNWMLDRDIIETGIQPWRFHPERLQESPLPTTLQHLLLTRLGLLGEKERGALLCGAVFGRLFWETGLEAMGVNESHAILERLQPLGFVEYQVESLLQGDPEWSFRHAFLRDVAYESILKRQRGELHRLAGGWLEGQARSANRLPEFAGVLGDHAERAGDTPAAGMWYRMAGDHAVHLAAMQQARRFYNLALMYIPSDDVEQRWQALLGRDQVQFWLGDTEARRSDDRSLLELAQNSGNPEWLAAAHLRFGWTCSFTGDEQQALGSFRAGLEAARQAAALDLEANAMGLIVQSCTRLGNLEGLRDEAEKALQLAYATGDPITITQNIINVSLYYVAVGDFGRAAQLLEQQVQILENMGDKVNAGVATINLGYNYMMLGMYDQALKTFKRAELFCEALQARRMCAYNQLNQGLALWRVGNLSASDQVLDSAIKELQQIQDNYGIATGVSYRGLVLEQAGEITEALDAYRWAEASFRELGAQGYALDALAGLARCAIARNEQEEALRLASQLWTALEQGEAQGMELQGNAFLTCARIYASTGEVQLSEAVVKRGNAELTQRANQISDLDWRSSYLENVPEHQLLRAWQERLSLNNLDGTSPAQD